MDYVVRRKTPRHNGTRYFNADGPAQSSVRTATRFTEAEATTAHRALREPHLWEVLTVSAAADMDGKIAEELRREHVSDVRHPRIRRLMTPLALSVAASGLADVPRRGST